jgi:hypothetical protein
LFFDLLFRKFAGRQFFTPQYRKYYENPWKTKASLASFYLKELKKSINLKLNDHEKENLFDFIDYAVRFFYL